MPSGPTISVVIPAYNAAKYLPATLGSVCRQEVLPLEVIVVDDGSTDDTAGVAARYAPLVKCHRQENAGVAAARNMGIHLASGTHVAFLDADDEWTPFHLADIAQALTELPVRWCGSAYGKRYGGEDSPVSVALNGLGGEDPILLEDYFIACAHIWRVWTSACAIERSLLLELGGFDESMRIGEDVDLWYRIALREPALGYCPRPSATYNQTQDSLMHQNPDPRQDWYEGLVRMERQARAEGADSLRKARPLLARYANSAARVAGRTSDRTITYRLMVQYAGLLAPSVWMRSVFSLLLPAGLNRRLWSLRS